MAFFFLFEKITIKAFNKFMAHLPGLEVNRIRFPGMATPGFKVEGISRCCPDKRK